MPREFTRRDRLAQAIGRELGALIATEVKDPRVRHAAIVDVSVSPDLRHARVYVGSFDVVAPAERGPEIVEELNSARGFLKKQLGRRLRLRVMPKLAFVHDTTERDAQALEQTIDAAVADDRRHIDPDDELS